jgi:putative membrane protein
MMMYWGAGMGPWGYVLMSVTTLVFLGLVIAIAVILVRSVGGVRPTIGAAPAPDAWKVLATRYARGEIDEAEFQRRLTVLSGHADRG